MAAYHVFGSKETELISDMFKLPHTIDKLSGVANGMLVQFKTFYLKIYNYSEKYTVCGYRYNDPSPVLSKDVKANEMKEFCSQFQKDDFLNEF